MRIYKHKNFSSVGAVLSVVKTGIVGWVEPPAGAGFRFITGAAGINAAPPISSPAAKPGKQTLNPAYGQN